MRSFPIALLVLTMHLFTSSQTLSADSSEPRHSRAHAHSHTTTFNLLFLQTSLLPTLHSALSLASSRPETVYLWILPSLQSRFTQTMIHDNSIFLYHNMKLLLHNHLLLACNQSSEASALIHQSFSKFITVDELGLRLPIH